MRAGDGRNATNVGNGTDVSYGRTWDRFGEVVPKPGLSLREEVKRMSPCREFATQGGYLWHGKSHTRPGRL